MKHIFIALIILLSFTLGYITCQSSKKGVNQEAISAGETSPQYNWLKFENKEISFKYPTNLFLKSDESYKTVALKETEFQIPLPNYLWNSEISFFVSTTEKNPILVNGNNKSNDLEQYIKDTGIEKNVTQATFYKKEMVIDGQKSIEISGYLTPLLSSGKSLYTKQVITQDKENIYNFTYILSSDTFTPTLFDEILSTVRLKNK